MKKKLLLTSILSIVMCLSLTIGGTFALFTSKSEVNVAVTSATVNVVARVEKTEYSFDSRLTEASNCTHVINPDDGSLDINYMMPGDTVTATVAIKNESNVAIKYKINTSISGELKDYLVITPAVKGWTPVDAEASIDPQTVVITLPYEEDDANAQGKSASVLITVEAVQGNYVPKWDGSEDTSWYNDQDTDFVLSTPEQFAGFASLVNDGNTFEGKTVKLGGSIDLYCEDTTPSADGDPLTFRPIGDHSQHGMFEGTFDGQGNTIKNIYQNGWDLGYEWGKYGSYGLFGNLNNATVKNLTLSGGESYIEGGDTSFVAGSATGTCVFENITITDSISATYNNGNGGIIGWSGAGNYTFRNITIAEDCVLAGLWGSFDSSIGGIVGQAEPGATYNFENVDVACRLDVYNDCTASYDYYNYRMCGMLIGRLEETTTIDGANYPDTSKYTINCNNVTVTYGEWANYHYCEPTPGLNGGRGMRVEPGYAYGGLPADFDHSQCVDNHMNLIAFDQIFGGDQIGVKGLKTYDGVTVTYNNSKKTNN